jgi:sugar phosphate isomerase/epimerase
MRIKFYAPLWGNTLPFDTFCANVKKAGYDGIEMGLPFDDKEKQSILDILKKHGLELVAQYWQSFEQDIEDHAKNYEKYIRVKSILFDHPNPIYLTRQELVFQR